MVLFKRKPVTFPDPEPLPENLNVKVWYISYTREWFLSYDEYLKRMDYYNTKKFVCEITGNSCLTFFEAFKSEEREMRIVESNFPEHLKEPILRHIQFSTVPRIDQLVDNVYSTFKNDYYPGETVLIRLNDYKSDFKTKCIIREKAKFNELSDANNVLRPAHCKYRVARVDSGLELVVDESQVTRDRNNFTKWFVKTFIKLSVTRSPKLGAPWMVKQKYADKFRISTELPPHLIHFKEEPKPPRKRLVLLRPKDQAEKKQRQASDKKAPQGLSKRNAPVLPRSGTVKVEISPAAMVPKRVVTEDLSQPFDLNNRKPETHQMDDLGDYVQDALETWTFLNVYRIPLLLDTFTFDDFLTALKWNSAKTSCPLLNEIFCAVLSVFMAEDGNELEIQFPEEFDNAEDDVIEDALVNTPRKTENGITELETSSDGNRNGSGVEEQEAADNDDISNSNNFEEEETNRVDEYLTYRNTSWIERLQKRNFKDGGWLIIMLGIFDEIRDHKEFKSFIKEVFDILAPIDGGLSPGHISNEFYNHLPIHLRIKCLSVLCSFIVNATSIRSHIDKCMEEAAQLRRERLENLREYKTAYQKAQDIDKECREAIGSAGTSVVSSIEQSNGEHPESSRLKRRRRAGLTTESTPEELELAKSSVTFGNLLASRTAQLRIADELRSQRRSLEKRIAELDVQRIKYIGKDRLYNRYWWFESNGLPNLGGGRGANEDDDEDQDDEEEDDDDEVLEETYLMGRLWVQGPSSEDLRNGLSIEQELVEEWKKLSKTEVIDVEGSSNEELESDQSKKAQHEQQPADTLSGVVDPMSQEEDSILSKPVRPLPSSFVERCSKVFQIQFSPETKAVTSTTRTSVLVDKYGATASDLLPVQRKIIEESPDPLLSPTDWRYYDTAGEIEDLIKWFNPWGERESKLLKELTNIKDKIISSINARRKALKLDGTDEEEQELLKILKETVLSESEVESSSESEGDDGTSDDAELELLSFEKVEDDDTRRTRKSIAAAERNAEERRQKEELIRTKIAERNAKRERSKPSLRVAKRELKKRKIKEHEEKKRLIEDSKEKLSQLKINNEIQRCLDWVNQSALEHLGHSHYDGPKKAKVSGRKGRR